MSPIPIDTTLTEKVWGLVHPIEFCDESGHIPGATSRSRARRIGPNRRSATRKWLAVSKKPGGKHWPLFAASPDTYLDAPTLDFVRARFPDAEIRGNLSGYASLISSTQAERVLGFKAKDGFR